MNQPDKRSLSQSPNTLRWLPRPGLSLLLFLIWLLLNNTIAAGHIVIGAATGLIIPLLTHPLMSSNPRICRPLLVIKYIAVMTYDIIICNLEVAVLICGNMDKLKPGILAFPLDLKDELPITLLASTISLTPGTVSAELSTDRRWLYIHVLHMQDESTTIRQIKSRYEKPLKEIFTCLKQPS